MFLRVCIAALLTAVVLSSEVAERSEVDDDPSRVLILAIIVPVVIVTQAFLFSVYYGILKRVEYVVNRERRARFEREGLSILEVAVYECAARNVTNGCKLGVGFGATGRLLVDYLALKYKSGHLKDITCVPACEETKRWLLDAGLPTSDLESTPELDIYIDGVDEVDEQFLCIKDYGIARAKFLQNASNKFFAISNGSKKSVNLGDHFNHVPIEVLPFAARPLLRSIVLSEGGTAQLRMRTEKSPQGEILPYRTENSNNIIDWVFDKTSEHDWPTIHRRLISMPGVVETGLFIDMIDKVYFAYPDGGTKEIAVPRDIV